ncbi:acetoacetyl-CoA synthetase [Nephila pilipes]|uniref:Acetoacetyl-CoA synthetase n=2 Tax=Nephila pilipes TaxID=299642 RepID=A0A8X6TGM1_NEPPI|nr:acetoacetyl-CoA synthetase [Nephila pilipes]
MSSSLIYKTQTVNGTFEGHKKACYESRTVSGTCEDNTKFVYKNKTLNGTCGDNKKTEALNGEQIYATQLRKVEPYLAWNKKVTGTTTEKFKKIIEQNYNVKLDSYWDLHKWSIDNCESFWAEIWNYFKVIASKDYEQVLVKTGPGFLDNKWFAGASLNYAENLLRIRDDRIALACLDEEGNFEEITYAQLFEEVKLYAAAFRKNGLRKGDTVCCMINNRKEAVIGCLAAASIGAIWTGIQAFYGAKSAAKIVNRLGPKFFLVCDGFEIENLDCRIIDKVPTIIENTPSIKKVIVVPTREETLSKGISHIRNSCYLSEFLESGKQPDGSVPDLIFEQLPFDHPLFIICTSGTTGLPKAPVHGAGTFLPLLIDVAFHWNLKPGDTLFNFVPVK